MKRGARLEELKKRYNEWLMNQTEEEAELYTRVLVLEQYFSDMCFEKETATGIYMMRNGEKYNFIEGLSVEEQYFCVKLADTQKDMPAYIDVNKREIVINPSYRNDTAVILHEMIHAHEISLEKYNPLLREIILIELYKNLKCKLRDLGISIDDLIYFHANVLHNKDLENEGGYHGLLYFLKSIDLDLKCGFELFTVFGYDYNRAFVEMGIIP